MNSVVQPSTRGRVELTRLPPDRPRACRCIAGALHGHARVRRVEVRLVAGPRHAVQVRAWSRPGPLSRARDSCCVHVSLSCAHSLPCVRRDGRTAAAGDPRLGPGFRVHDAGRERGAHVPVRLRVRGGRLRCQDSGGRDASLRCAYPPAMMCVGRGGTAPLTLLLHARRWSCCPSRPRSASCGRWSRWGAARAATRPRATQRNEAWCAHCAARARGMRGGCVLFRVSASRRRSG